MSNKLFIPKKPKLITPQSGIGKYLQQQINPATPSPLSTGTPSSAIAPASTGTQTSITIDTTTATTGPVISHYHTDATRSPLVNARIYPSASYMATALDSYYFTYSFATIGFCGPRPASIYNFYNNAGSTPNYSNAYGLTALEFLGSTPTYIQSSGMYNQVGSATYSSDFGPTETPLYISDGIIYDFNLPGRYPTLSLGGYSYYSHGSYNEIFGTNYPSYKWNSIANFVLINTTNYQTQVPNEGTNIAFQIIIAGYFPSTALQGTFGYNADNVYMYYLTQVPNYANEMVTPATVTGVCYPNATKFTSPPVGYVELYDPGNSNIRVGFVNITSTPPPNNTPRLLVVPGNYPLEFIYYYDQATGGYNYSVTV